MEIDGEEVVAPSIFEVLEGEGEEAELVPESPFVDIPPPDLGPLCFHDGCTNQRLILYDLDGTERKHTVCAEHHNAETCHICDPFWRPMKVDVRKPEPLHRILREVLRGYTVFEEYVTITGNYEITHQGYKFNFLDLQGCLKSLPQRQMEAVYWFIIQDERQKTVAARLGISTVTVGQYCDQAMRKITEELFPEEGQ